MKELFIALLAVVMVMSLCACSSTNETPAPEISEKVNAVNPMFVDIGDTVVINGVEWSASMMFYNENTDTIAYNDMYSYFAVNRVNMHIFYIRSSSGKTGTAYALDTGLIYEGDLIVGGTNTVVPTN